MTSALLNLDWGVDSLCGSRVLSCLAHSSLSFHKSFRLLSLCRSFLLRAYVSCVGMCLGEIILIIITIICFISNYRLFYIIDQAGSKLLQERPSDHKFARSSVSATQLVRFFLWKGLKFQPIKIEKTIRMKCK